MGWGGGGGSAAGVAHPAETDRFEEPALAESTEVAANVGRRFTALPQRGAVGRRGGSLPDNKFTLRGKKNREEEETQDQINVLLDQI